MVSGHMLRSVDQATAWYTLASDHRKLIYISFLGSSLGKPFRL